MAVHQVREIPHIPGYTVGRLDDVGGLVAERVLPLSAYQAQQGCRDRVVADDAGELQMLCMAEEVKAELVASAERKLREPRQM
jgi:hypothetical protein